MRIEKNIEERYTIIKISEQKLNSDIAPKLKSEFIALNADGVSNIIVNLQDVEYIDSSGLSALLTANRLCTNAGGVFVICCLTSFVEQLIVITKLEEVFNIIPTQSEAAEQVMMADIEAELLAQTGGATPTTN